jgi:GT2 family glycosyltransferase
LGVPRASVTLVTFEGMRWLPACLASIRDQGMADFELLVLDNGSSDGTPDYLRDLAAREPRMSLTESAQNLGFAVGHNRLIERASADFVLLLNQDVVLDPAFLEHVLAAFAERPRVAAIQARLLRLDSDGGQTDVIDSTGLVMQRDRRVVSRRQGEREAAQDLHAGEVWGADGPAPAYRRAALMEARLPRRAGGWEILDEDFFMYKEDVDLAWRLRLLGWEAWYEPRALAWHARSAGAGPARTMLDVARSSRGIPRWIKQVSWRNQRLMQVKNERGAEFLRDLPWILRREVLAFGFMVLTDPLRLAAVGQLLRALPAARAKRRYLQRIISERHQTPGGRDRGK